MYANNTIIHFIINYTLIIVTGLLVFVAVSHILYHKRSAYSMTSWLLAVILLPHISVPLYFLAGIRKIDPKRHKSAVSFEDSRHIIKSNVVQNSCTKIFEENGIPHASDHNRYHLITSGEDAFMQMMVEIDRANESIHISTYVFSHDESTHEIIKALSRKARDSVEVYILMDLVGSFGAYLRQEPFDELRKSGGKILFFSPLLKNLYKAI